MEQVSLPVRDNLVVSFQESDAPLFLNIDERLERSRGQIRQSSATYLVYAPLDNVVDGYFKILWYLGQRVEELGEALIAGLESVTL